MGPVREEATRAEAVVEGRPPRTCLAQAEKELVWRFQLKGFRLYSKPSLKGTFTCPLNSNFLDFAVVSDLSKSIKLKKK